MWLSFSTSSVTWRNGTPWKLNVKRWNPSVSTGSGSKDVKTQNIQVGSLIFEPRLPKVQVSTILLIRFPLKSARASDPHRLPFRIGKLVVFASLSEILHGKDLRVFIRCRDTCRNPKRWCPSVVCVCVYQDYPSGGVKRGYSVLIGSARASSQSHSTSFHSRLEASQCRDECKLRSRSLPLEP